jgi:hypothetical protein
LVGHIKDVGAAVSLICSSTVFTHWFLVNNGFEIFDKQVGKAITFLIPLFFNQSLMALDLKNAWNKQNNETIITYKRDQIEFNVKMFPLKYYYFGTRRVLSTKKRDK